MKQKHIRHVLCALAATTAIQVGTNVQAAMIINIDPQSVANQSVTINVGGAGQTASAAEGLVINIDETSMAQQQVTINVGPAVQAPAERAVRTTMAGQKKKSITTAKTATPSPTVNPAPAVPKEAAPQTATYVEPQVIDATPPDRQRRPVQTTAPVAASTVVSDRPVVRPVPTPAAAAVPAPATATAAPVPVAAASRPANSASAAAASSAGTATVMPRTAVRTLVAAAPKTAAGQTGSMLQQFTQAVPDWTYGAFQNLAGAGLLFPDEDMNLKSLNRREGAILTARSYNHLHSQRRSTSTSEPLAGASTAASTVQSLMREFLPEVQALGYAIGADAVATKVTDTSQWDWKVGGEIRYSFARNSGAPRYSWNDNRWRLRLYAEKGISDHWRVYGMVESDKSNISRAHEEAVGRHTSNDGDIELSRIYLQGNYRWWQIPFTIEAGKTYAYLGDGNILDSDFHGVTVTAAPTTETRVSAGVGNVNDTESLQYLEGLRQHRQYDYLGGIYHWDNYGRPTTIYSLGMNYYTGNFTFGGMYLGADRADGSGAKDGYVLTARYGKNFSWIPKTYEFTLKYYNQAGQTYINHTMNGVGGYMDGFSGWSAAFYYTLRENLLFSLQYYDLEDKTTNESGRTLWSELSWGF